MPLPWIVGGLIAGGAALLGSAAREVNENLEHDLNRINREMEDMHKNATSLVEKTSAEFKQATKNYDSTKNHIVKTTLKDYYLILKELKNNIGYCGDYQVNEDFGFLDYKVKSYHDNSVFISSLTSVSNEPDVFDMGLNILEGVFLGFSAIKGVSLMYKIDDAIAEKKKLRAECQKVEIKCTEIAGSTKFLRTATETLKTLKCLTDNLNNETKILLEGKNYDLKTLTKEEFLQVKTMANFNQALDNIVNISLLDEQGKIRSEFKTALRDGKETISLPGR